MNRQQEYNALMLELESIPADMMQMSAKTKTRARRRNVMRYTAIPSGLFMAILLIITIAVNTSPTVASAFERIPVLRQIVTLVRFNQSLTDAIEHKFIQRIDQEQMVNDITMRVEYVVVDQRQLNVFYTLESSVYTHINSFISVLDVESRQEKPVSVFETTDGDLNNIGTLRMATINFAREQMPARLILKARVDVLDAPQIAGVLPKPMQNLAEQEYTAPEIVATATFEFVLEFDPAFTEQGDTFFVNQDFMIDGQRLTLTTVEIYPTHMRANFSADPANTAWLTSLRFYAENEYGDRFGAISNGIIAFGAHDSPMMVSHIMDSPFFAESSHLTLFIEQVVWLDKDMERVKVDLVNGTANNLPNGVTLSEVRQDGTSWQLYFAVVEQAEYRSHQVFGHSCFDETGNEFWTASVLSGIRFNNISGFAPGVFYERVTIRDYSHDVVYLAPLYSRVALLTEPVALKVR
ncbi:MAG: DUF4179 domain-containing protein [Dehalococcoidia bacterium]|nr:DUF4179 domain-containing protein [Dehalococcoidia bacterium]